MIFELQLYPRRGIRERSRKSKKLTHFHTNQQSEAVIGDRLRRNDSVQTVFVLFPMTTDQSMDSPDFLSLSPPLFLVTASFPGLGKGCDGMEWDASVVTARSITAPDPDQIGSESGLTLASSPFAELPNPATRLHCCCFLMDCSSASDLLDLALGRILYFSLPLCPFLFPLYHYIYWSSVLLALSYPLHC